MAKLYKIAAWVIIGFTVCVVTVRFGQMGPDPKTQMEWQIRDALRADGVEVNGVQCARVSNIYHACYAYTPTGKALPVDVDLWQDGSWTFAEWSKP